MAIGPVQLLVVGFEAKHEFTGEILAELQRLREHDIVRLIDLMVVRREADGEVEAIQVSDLSEEEAEEFGAVVGALIGFGAAGEEGAEAGALAGAEALEDRHALDEKDVWYLADAIPDDSTAAIALLEHRWAIPLRDKILEEGGTVFADTWVHPSDLVAVGLAAAADDR